jgi:hypothetical protein
MMVFWIATSAHAQMELLVDVLVDGGNDFDWEQIELPGTVCGNGSQYSFYVWDDPASDDLLLYFEGGGACWDYAGCTGQNGVLGAANPNGLVDDYMSGVAQQYVSPVVNGADPGLPLRSRTELPTAGWDVVYMPYCTGDVHTGNSVVLYEDPSGTNPPVTWYHHGYNNTTAALQYLDGRFPAIDKLLVSGFSAGGTASSSVYYKARTTLNVAKGYLLADSGPIYPAPDSTYNSRQLHDLITQQWGIVSLFDELPVSFDPSDFGSINGMLATEFPDDQLAYIAFSSDYNYSRFSYETFAPGLPQADALALWREDQANLIAELDDYPNYSWHVPWHRPINDSHCVSIITFIGSHACSQMLKKKYWWEYLQWPLGQTYKCYSEFLPLETFLERWLEQDQISRIVEPQNAYNEQDPGMQLVAPLIQAALDGT